MAQVHGMQQMAAPNRADSIKKLTNFMGAAISVALVLGIGIWGYKLLVRDVSGVPVIRAVEGPVRVQPEDPGGSQARHQGLAVNTVAAEGGAGGPVDQLVLAPQPLELSLEDEPTGALAGNLVEIKPEAAPEPEAEIVHETPQAEAGERAAQSDQEDVQLASVDTLVARIVKDVDPISDTLAPELDTATVTGGLGKSLRPQIRPARARVQQAAARAPETSDEVDAATIATGTRLAQLGAFESAEIARSEWDRLSRRFGEYLEDKKRVVQKAKSGGRTFYRLRAMGFADLNDARRFCSALVAENAECIPVVTR